TLVLYTDGLVDRRPTRDGQVLDNAEALRLLREEIAKVAHEPVERIAEAAINAVPGDIDDDMAILVLRSADDTLESFERTFPAQPIMVGEARRMAAEVFASWNIPEERGELACLLVSEVVTNVVLHAANSNVPRRALVLDGPPLPFDDWDDPLLGEEAEPEKEFRLRLRRGEKSIWVEVFDQDLRLPRIRSAGENDEGGRGLYLVDQLASRWGSRPTNEGKAVWFEIPAWGNDRTGRKRIVCPHTASITMMKVIIMAAWPTALGRTNRRAWLPPEADSTARNAGRSSPLSMCRTACARRGSRGRTGPLPQYASPPYAGARSARRRARGFRWCLSG